MDIRAVGTKKKVSGGTPLKTRMSNSDIHKYGQSSGSIVKMVQR